MNQVTRRGCRSSSSRTSRRSRATVRSRSPARKSTTASWPTRTCSSKTSAQELDYPAGDQNVYTTYEGKGGVSIGSLWRKLVFSAHYATLRMLLSQTISTHESRILYHRQIQERVKKIAPFITFDRDPYLVIAKAGGLFWIVDGYTTSDRYPYSEPTAELGNYIRNSVKVVVDAYNGTVDFYVVDPRIPRSSAYAKIFPGLFKPLEAMPEDLRAHIRYPQDFLRSRRACTPRTTCKIRRSSTIKRTCSAFRERVQSRPQGREGPRRGDGTRIPTTRSCGCPAKKRRGVRSCFCPLLPTRRDNMRAWLAARSDPPHYGKLIALDFPKAKLVYGPKQIDARIDQDAFISQQLEPVEPARLAGASAAAYSRSPSRNRSSTFSPCTSRRSRAGCPS